MSRWQYFPRRVLMSIPVVILGTTITFALTRLGPLDPVSAVLGTQYNPQATEQTRTSLGLNQPLRSRCLDLMYRLFTFQFGQSWVIVPGTTAHELIEIYMPWTIRFGFWSVVTALFVGIPLGFYAGLNPNTPSDYAASLDGVVWRAMPNFWLAIMLVAALSQLGMWTNGLFTWQTWIVRTNVVMPLALDFFQSSVEQFLEDPGGWIESLVRMTKQIAPAALVFGSASMGNETRIGRITVLETINSNYVKTTRAKGVSGCSLVWKHIFRNALTPFMSINMGEAFLLLGGSVFVETALAINGLGWLFFNVAINGDLPLIGTLMFIFILILAGANILQDFPYMIIDSRIGYDG